MNEDWSEKILDSFLEEIISGKSPPDLTDRIVARLKIQQSVSQSQESPQDSIPLPEVPDDQDADRSWWQQVVHIPPVESDLESPIRLASKSNPNLRKVDLATSNNKKRRQALALAMGFAACSLAIVGLFWVLPELDGSRFQLGQSPTLPISPKTNSNANADSPNNPNSARPANSPLPSNVASANTPSDKKSEVSADSSETSLQRPERLDIKGLPFAVVEPDAMPPSSAAIASPTEELALTDSQVVSEINKTFDSLWNENQLTVQNSIADGEWLQRTAIVLMGIKPTSTQLELFINAEDSDKRDYLLNQATSSERFSRFFAKQIAAILVPENKPATAAWREDFELWLTQNIAQRTPYNEVVRKLLVANQKLNADASSPTGRPEEYWLTSLRDSHGHRVAQRVSTLWLNQSLQCSQCHDQGTGSDTSQSAYWSMVAALNINNKPEIFFERSDGTLRAAVPALPNGESLESLPIDDRRAAFANWLVASPAMAEGTVNLAWKLVFGSPLVSTELAMQDATAEKRTKLLKTLAQQFRVHRYDLPRLVMWIAASKPFASPSRAITQRDWLLASEVELREIRTGEQLFASYRRLELLEVDSSSLLQQVVRFEREDAGNQLKRTVLAQPMPSQSLPNDEVNSLDKEPLPAWQQDLRLHASADSDSLHQQLIRRLLKSKLTWPQLVQHALGYEPNPQELRLADELLQYHSGNKETTLLKLHWTTHHSVSL